MKQIPEEQVQAMCEKIEHELLTRTMFPHTVFLEMKAFAETRTLHAARQLANALRHIERREDLAREVEAIIEASPDHDPK